MARLTATVARTLMYNAHGSTTSYTDTHCDDWTVQRLGWSLDTAFNVHALRQRRLDSARGRILLCQVLNSTLSSNTTAHARCHQLRCTSPLIAVQPRLADLEGVSKDYKHLRVDSSVPARFIIHAVNLTVLFGLSSEYVCRLKTFIAQLCVYTAFSSTTSHGLIFKLTGGLYPVFPAWDSSSHKTDLNIGAACSCLNSEEIVYKTSLE
ncbi:hypothetical protein CPB85DRAFT_1260083 [Mucidula mucida]|nr:hypothetical protein CPB85DRAFT_1260083 [Mucidula mucida]